MARRWARQNPGSYARVLAAETGVQPRVARLVFDTDAPVPVPIDEGVIADQQKTADRYFAANIIHTRLDATRIFDASFNGALAE